MLFLFVTLVLVAHESLLAYAAPARNCLRFRMPYHMKLSSDSAARKVYTGDPIYARQWSQADRAGPPYRDPAVVHGVTADWTSLCFGYHIVQPTSDKPIYIYMTGDDAVLFDYIELTDNTGRSYQWGTRHGGYFCMSIQNNDHHGDWDDVTDHCYNALKLWYNDIGALPRDKFEGLKVDDYASWTCYNTCRWAYDGDCDDGGADSHYDICEKGSDCYDCGDRREVSVGAGALLTADKGNEYASMVQCHQHENKQQLLSGTGCTEQEMAWLETIDQDEDHWVDLNAQQSIPGTVQKHLSKMSYSLVRNNPTLMNFFAFIGAGFVLFMVGKQCVSKKADFQTISSEI